ncbi:hypothetical protein MBEHAL_1523 [Halarchaeum acidiphilum MH1-52-1]|uniref:Small CPxCG-related zinc finger protein n=1 Tax=Halarchaeum acidiphilum MH1-52-1 TaxID=1261545 RepID=U3ADA7_9EURY|nr:DUF6276 family protein [Halarchaeum acidiphilum]GAD52763.1 hypothetical protein MBEHAL_1523 [Halarchaeum acidiphilum MH1-52-1]
MPCQRCGAPTLSFPTPADLRAHLPDDRAGATICTRCLAVAPSDEPPSDVPDFRPVSDAFPRNEEAAVALACLLALLDSLVLYRDEIDAVATYAETHGTDVLRFLERLDADDDLKPHFDVARRTRQLEQLI